MIFNFFRRLIKKQSSIYNLEKYNLEEKIEKLKQTEKKQLETICKLVKELDETKEALDEAKETIKAYQEISLNPSKEDKERAVRDCEKLINKIIEER